MQPPNDVEAALAAEVDVDQADVGPELHGTPDRVVAVRGSAHHNDALTLQQTAGSLQEPRAVIDDQAMQRHGFRMASRRPADTPAT